MRAPIRATTIAPSADENVTAGLALRIVIACMLTVVLLFLWRPSAIPAQAAPSLSAIGYVSGDVPGSNLRGGSSSGLHRQDGNYTVTTRGGELLRDIAVRFYGDTARWRDLATANNIAAENGAYSVKVGTQLRIPGKSASEVAAILRSSRPAQEPPRSLAAQTAGKGDAKSAAAAGAGGADQGRKADSISRAAVQTANAAEAARAAADERPLERTGVRIGLVTPEEMRLARGTDEPTIFMGKTAGSEAEARQAIEAAVRSHSAPRPRDAEFAAAPYVVEKGGLARTGMIVGRATSSGGIDRDADRVITLAEDAIIRVPPGSSSSTAERFSVVVPGPSLPGGARVVVPVGVVEVVRSEPGKPVIARVVRQSGVIEKGQALVPLTGSAAPAGIVAVADESRQLAGRVRYVHGDQLLPTLQTFLVIDVTEKQGVRQGDEFSLFVPAGPDGRKEERVAIVRIVRADGMGSTGIVIHQDRPGIEVGVLVRRTASATLASGN